MTDGPQSLADLLRSGRLAQLGREAERRRATATEIRALLPAEEASHLVGAAFEETGELVLVMDSPTWAARVRYWALGLPAERVRVRVRPPGSSSDPS